MFSLTRWKEILQRHLCFSRSSFNVEMTFGTSSSLSLSLPDLHQRRRKYLRRSATRRRCFQSQMILFLFVLFDIQIGFEEDSRRESSAWLIALDVVAEEMFVTLTLATGLVPDQSIILFSRKGQTAMNWEFFSTEVPKMITFSRLFSDE